MMTDNSDIEKMDEFDEQIKALEIRSENINHRNAENDFRDDHGHEMDDETSGGNLGDVAFGNVFDEEDASFGEDIDELSAKVHSALAANIAVSVHLFDQLQEKIEIRRDHLNQSDQLDDV
jgi:hypothetical protein